MGRRKECFELPFYAVTANRFAVADPALSVAEIVEILLRPALRPAGGIGLTAIAAEDEPANSEILWKVLASWRLGGAFAPRLYPLICFDGDDHLVLALEPMDVICLGAYVASVERAGEHVGGPLLGDLT